jgi:hypothetical protein
MSELSWGTLRQKVYERANGCCEYCQTCDANTGQTMHVDHIAPKGSNSLENLCLACSNCNASKHKAVEAIDPNTGNSVSLFNPRMQIWTEHFEWLEGGILLQGKSESGRATIIRLKMNRQMIVAARERWIKNGFHPPK